MTTPEQFDRLRTLQRNRVFAIVQQSRSDRACESYIASRVGFKPDLPEAERKKLFDLAAKMRKAIERGKKGKMPADASPALVDELKPIVIASAAGRGGFDELRETAEAEMVEIAKNTQLGYLPAHLAGFTLKGLAVILGEAGDLSGYANPGKLWKRFGLAPFKGRAAGTWRRAGGLTAPEWQEIGFKPLRLGQLYGVVTVPLFMAKAKNPYGPVYAEIKARYDQRVIETKELPTKIGAKLNPEKWTPKRADNAARRYMTKRLLRDLWRAWREANGVLEPSDVVPRAEIPQDADA